MTTPPQTIVAGHAAPSDVSGLLKLLNITPMPESLTVELVIAFDDNSVLKAVRLPVIASTSISADGTPQAKCVLRLSNVLDALAKT